MKRIRDEELRLEEKLDRQGRVIERIWLNPHNGLPHREFGPAKQIFDPEFERLTCEIWINQYQHGRHRPDNLPSEIVVDAKTGVVILELYERNDRLHRDDGGPTETFRDSLNGEPTYIAYHFEGALHRDCDLPAVQEFCPTTGKLTHEEYFQDGMLHRANGPAVVSYDENGRALPDSLSYFNHGDPVSRIDPHTLHLS